jgi:hypothetical protein
VAAVSAVVLGLAAGSFGIASAASGSGSSGSSSGTAAATTPSTPARQPWGVQRGDETLLTADTAVRVRELALAKVPGGTVVRVETDADGHAAYEAHMTDAKGNPVTVYVDKSLNVVGVDSGGPGLIADARSRPARHAVWRAGPRAGSGVSQGFLTEAP